MNRLNWVLWIVIVLLLSACGSVKPDADAGPDQVVQVGDLVTLDGSASSDHDNDPLTFAWTITEAPAASVAALSDPAAVNPTFTPDIEGNYRFDLTVSDQDWSDTDSVTVTALLTATLPDGTVPVLVFHSTDIIYGWHVGATLADADTLINTDHPTLVADWNAGNIVATEIALLPINAYQPELYQAVNGEIVLK